MDKDNKLNKLISIGIEAGFIKKSKPMITVWDYKNNRPLLMKKALYDKMIKKI